MKGARSERGLTVLEMVAAMAVIAVLASIYFVMTNSYKERRMSELAAKALVQAAKAQEQYFAEKHYYFDAEVSAGGEDMLLTTPAGIKTTVRIPAHVVLSMKAQGRDRRGFIGYAFYTGSKKLHRYDSKTGKVQTVARVQEES